MHPFNLRPVACALALSTSLVCATLAGAATPQAHEATLKLAQSVEPGVVAQLAQMVRIESGSAQAEGLAQMAGLLEARLQALGMEVTRHASAVDGGADAVVAQIKGQGQANILLLGHMDTAHGKGSLEQTPYQADDQRIQGPGAADDKGGLALMLGVLHMAQASNWTDFGTLTVLVNADSETGSAGSRALISELASQHDVVLSFEPSTAGQPTLLLGTAGIAHATLTVETDAAARAASANDDSANALYELAWQMLTTADAAQDVDGIALHWTVAQTGGNAVNQIPTRAQAVADVRFTRAGAEQELLQALTEHVTSVQLMPGAKVAVELELQQPMLQANNASQALAGKAQAIYQELGLDLELVPMAPVGTDAAFAAASDQTAVLEGLGPAGGHFHAAGEFVETGSIVPRLYLVTRLLQEIAASS